MSESLRLSFDAATASEAERVGGVGGRAFRLPSPVGLDSAMALEVGSVTTSGIIIFDGGIGDVAERFGGLRGIVILSGLRSGGSGVKPALSIKYRN